MADGTVSRPALLPVKGPERTALTLPDGVELVADIWRPDTTALLPVLLIRQPYGRAIASTVTLAHPSWYAAHGYVVVVQDVRGTGDSGGDFDALVHEAADGAATLDWARGIAGGNGKVGTYGFSYHGTTQFLTLAGGGRPDAMAIAMASFQPGADWPEAGGLFPAAAMTGWAGQMARLKAHHAGDAATLAELERLTDWPSLFDYLTARPDLSHLARWARGEAGSLPASALEPPPAIPLMQVMGANDFLNRGALAADAAFRAVAPDTTHLVLGPWTHFPWNRAAGPTRLGPGAEMSVDRAQLAFFDHYLKGTGPRPAACRAYDPGTDAWADADPNALHRPPSLSCNLASDGLAATLLTNGQLLPQDAPGPAPQSDAFVIDPTKPLSLIGGSLGTPPGIAEVSAQHDRADVACYTTAPLTRPLRLFGPADASITATVTGDWPALAATLSRVLPDGRALTLATAVAPARTGPVRFAFPVLSQTLAAGQALRLTLQAAPCPAFVPFPATALPRPGIAATTVTIDHAGSALALPAPAF